MDPDNAAVDEDGNPAVWLQLPDPAGDCSRQASAAASTAAAGGGVAQLDNGRQQQSASGDKQATIKDSRDSSKLDWQPACRDMLAMAVLRVCTRVVPKRKGKEAEGEGEEGAGEEEQQEQQQEEAEEEVVVIRVLFVTLATNFELSAADGELTVRM
jgi:hypothetical protein